MVIHMYIQYHHTCMFNARLMSVEDIKLEFKLNDVNMFRYMLCIIDNICIIMHVCTHTSVHVTIW